MQLERARSVVAAREGLVVANSMEWGSCKPEEARVVVAQMEDGLMQLRRAKARESWHGCSSKTGKVDGT